MKRMLVPRTQRMLAYTILLTVFLAGCGNSSDQREATLRYWAAIQESNATIVSGIEDLSGNEPTVENYNALRSLMLDAASVVQRAPVKDVHPAVLELGTAHIDSLNQFVDYCNKGAQHQAERDEIQSTANSWVFLANCAASGFKGVLTGDPFRPINELESQSDALMTQVPQLQADRLASLESLTNLAKIRMNSKKKVAEDLGIELPED